MLKCDSGIVNEVISFINESSRAVSTILKKEGALDNNDIDKLSRLYSMRRSKLDLLDSWYKSDEGTAFVHQHPEEWKAIVKKIITTDGDILKKFEIRVKDLGETIRKLVHKKSILIYSKEQ